MNICLKGDITDLELGLNQILPSINVKLNENGKIINVTKINDSDNCLEIGNGYIKYKEKNHFFRALFHYINMQENDTLEEKVYIKYCDIMVDVSRNAVYKVEKIKEILNTMAVLGYNRFMLYTEDTYTIEGYNYFGYLRGKYSDCELKEIDDYAFNLGIEVIPCIQTLAHLKQALQWDCMSKLGESEDTLFVGEPKVYDFIESMIKSLRKNFRTKNVHIGMDEAFTLGRGEYLSKNGYKPHFDIMIEHLEKVSEILSKYNFTPMMWDDMLFRASSPNADYYDDATLSSEIKSKIPENMGFVYWDYYHESQQHYDTMISNRQKTGHDVIFAGGIWKWCGYAPSYEKTFATTKSALTACKDRKVEHVIATAWGDDGSEAPFDTLILGMILFAEHTYNKDVSDELLNKRCIEFTGLGMKDFMCLEDIDLIPSVPRPNIKVLNPSKYLLYQDTLLGAFDKHIEGLDLYNHYSNISKHYFDIAKTSEKYKDLFTLYHKLSEVLKLKSSLGINLRKAYKSGNKEELKNLLLNFIKPLDKVIEEFSNSMRALWMKTSKPQGYEVIDIRIAGVKARVQTAGYRIEQYLNGNIEKIEELEEEILPYFSVAPNIVEGTNLVNLNMYKRIATINTF